MNPHYLSLEFDTILKQLSSYALSDSARSKLTTLQPWLEEDLCLQKMQETTSARRLLDSLGNPPLPPIENMQELLTLALAGSMLLPEQLGAVMVFCNSCRRMKNFLAKGESIDELVSFYGRSIELLDGLQQEIENCIHGEKLLDNASPALKNIRRKKEHLETQIREKLNAILQSRKQYLADSYITTKQGHFVVPVQRKFQSQFSGTVIEASGKGNTVFMEPASVSKYQQELSLLGLEEDAEERRILYTLTALVAECAPPLRRNMEAIETLDMVFAKAKLSADMGAVPVDINCRRRLDIRQGRHPLLEKSRCVPLDFSMDSGSRGVIITGPNTGGKTVAVKTVGLLSLMAQCGLHIPCAPGSTIAMQDGYWCDIGDSQNISQNLSTFSGHITNVISILELASPDSLVLLDELGSGTDPAEGMGIAIAVLEELRRKNCMFLVTTHYPQVKNYAAQADGIQAARMAFDPETLRPLYRLEMGKSGESCALLIAKRLGFAPHLLQRAQYEVYGGAPPADPPPLAATPKSRLVPSKPSAASSSLAGKFSMGDSVLILPEEEIAIVYLPPDKNGDVVVQVKGAKRRIKHNRLQLRVPASELYPPDYDFSILFETVAHRKAKKQMSKHHSPGLVIQHPQDDF